MIQISVTENDIRNGRRRDRCDCPIARAVRRTLNNMAVVTAAGIFTSDAKYRHTDASMEFMLDFDQGFDVQPFTFELVAVLC